MTIASTDCLMLLFKHFLTACVTAKRYGNKVISLLAANAFDVQVLAAHAKVAIAERWCLLLQATPGQEDSRAKI